MGGDVWVDSSEGVGSGFGFFFPLEAVDDVELDDITVPSWMDRAIVLDGDGVNRTVLLKQLGLIGLKTSTVEIIDDVAAARPSQRDVVILGHGVSDDDPFEAARAIREQFSPAGIFLLVSGPTKVPAGRMAFDRLLQRPVLRAAMMECLIALEPPEFAEATAETTIEDALEPDSDAPEATEVAGTSSDPSSSTDTIAPEDSDVETPIDDEHGEYGEASEIKPSVEEATPQRMDIRLPTSPPDGRRQMRVLAAEDNRTNRFVFEKMLKDLDIDLVFAVNGLEAIEMFSDARPDIFFTDISMPKMDGKEATRRIRAMETENDLAPCPIIAITAHAMDGDAQQILEAGVDHYLTKPLKKQQLIDYILGAQPLDALPAIPAPDDGQGDASDDADQLRATAAE